MFDGLGRRILQRAPDVHFRVANELGLTSWSKVWLKELVNRQEKISAEQLVAHWDHLIDVLNDDEMHDLIVFHAADPVVADAIDPDADEPADPAMLVRLLDSIQKAEDISETTASSIREPVKRHLANRSTEEWSSELRNDGEWLSVLRKLPNGYPKLGVAYREAIRDHAISLAQGDLDQVDPTGGKPSSKRAIRRS